MYLCIWILLVHILSQKIHILEIMLINLKLKAEEAGKGI